MKLTAKCKLLPPFFVLICIAAMGCSSQQNTETLNTIDVSVHYLDRSMLPPGSTLTVSLLDISLADAKSTTVSEQKHQIKSAPPYKLTLPYEKTAIKPGHSYSISATIHQQQRLLYTSTSIVNPFSSSNIASGNPINIKLEKVSQAPISKPSISMLRGTWFVRELDQQLVNKAKLRKPLSITFADNKVHGYSGCNGFHGTVNATRERVKFGQLASTMMLCDEAANNIESSMHNALNVVHKFDIVNDELLFKDDKNKVVMRLIRPPHKERLNQG